MSSELIAGAIALLGTNLEVLTRAISVGVAFAGFGWALRQWYIRKDDRLDRIRALVLAQAGIKVHQKRTMGAPPERPVPQSLEEGMSEIRSLLYNLQQEQRRGAIWGFVQNLGFFIAGTVTSVVLPAFIKL